MIKYVIRNDDEHSNVESSLLFIVRNLKYVQVEFCYKLHM